MTFSLHSFHCFPHFRPWICLISPHTALWYIVSLAMAFVNAAESARKGEKPPGNRTGFAMIFSWLVPVILLSADTGRFVSRSVCLHLHRKLEHRLNAKQGPRSGRMLANRVMSQVGGWGGAAYTYRPEKPLFATGPYDRSPRHLFLIAASFVFLACSAGFTICYLTPKVGLSCRRL